MQPDIASNIQETEESSNNRSNYALDMLLNVQLLPLKLFFNCT